MNSAFYRVAILFVTIGAVTSCEGAGGETSVTADASPAADLRGASPPNPTIDIDPHLEQKPSEDCARGRVSREWLFSPTLAPIPPGPVNRRNSANRVHRLRDRIVRVEIAHSVTHRHLFELDAVAIEALHEVPEWPPLQLRSKSRPAGGPDWPVVFLIYVEGEELPYLGHPVYNELYFAEDEDPWHWYVWDDDGGFRDIHPIPFGSRV